ncbi:pyrophosphohydrolase [Dolichospermum phage Dfl-JY45]
MSEHAQASYDLVAHLVRQQAWSRKTFGPGDRAAAILDHIRKELAEVAANPRSVEEWIDIAMLALDGAWRSGASTQEVAEALRWKLTVNESRTWPDWRAAEPGRAIEHVREGAPASELAVFTATWWSSVAWANQEIDVLAPNEAAVRALVDRECPAEFRGQPYCKESTDSLKITRGDAVALPYVIRQRDM